MNASMTFHFFVAFPVVLMAQVVQAFCASSLWQWFAVPLGLPSIGAAHAFGLLLLVAVARPRATGEEDIHQVVKLALGRTGAFLLTLGIGRMALEFMP